MGRISYRQGPSEQREDPAVTHAIVLPQQLHELDGASPLLMRASSPRSRILQELYRLDVSSFEFHDQLNDTLDWVEDQECVSRLRGNDLIWFVDYLDEVRCSLALPGLC